MSLFIKIFLIVQMIIFVFFHNGNHISEVHISNSIIRNDLSENNLCKTTNYNLIEEKKGDIKAVLIEEDISNISFTNTFSFEKDAIIGTVNSQFIINNIKLDKIVSNDYKMVFCKHDFKLYENEPYINIDYRIDYTISDKNSELNERTINYSKTINCVDSKNSLFSYEGSNGYLNIPINIDYNYFPTQLDSNKIVCKKIEMNITYILQCTAVMGDLYGTIKPIDRHLNYEFTFLFTTSLIENKWLI